MKCSLGISNFLEKISSLTHSIVFLYFFDHWGRLSYISLLFFGTLHSNGNTFPFLCCFLLLFFSQLFVRTPQTAILLFCISFSWDGLDLCLLYNVMKLHPQFFRHRVCQIQFLESICHFQCLNVRDIRWYLSFSDWLISLSITISKSIHVVANNTISFFFKAD